MKSYNIPQNRGAKPKYDFDGMTVGEHREFAQASNTQVLLNCAKSYSFIRSLGWAFKCYTHPDKGVAVIVRVK